MVQVRRATEMRDGYFSRSRILSNPASAQLWSSMAPGAPLAPMPPTTSLSI
jgi:hypothetical protein